MKNNAFCVRIHLILKIRIILSARTMTYFTYTQMKATHFNSVNRYDSMLFLVLTAGKIIFYSFKANIPEIFCKKLE